MNIYLVFGIIIVVVVLVLLIYRTPQNARAAIKAEPKLLVYELPLPAVDPLSFGLTVNEQLSLTKGAQEPEIVIKAHGSAKQYQEIGIMYHEVVYNELDGMRVRGKIVAVHTSAITIEISY
ncbi:hypothetical protein [Flavobacterium rhizosphaerae]|uniref:NfeD-like C-terminal domain-containing protein n=1 Tax=Flavobacterium rhizosphaerae TaxID=3163298 RepID=A0ABW8Z250_9FLAO